MPCFPDLEDSPCCGKNGTCLANGLCQNSKSNLTARGTCTDRTWKSSNCPQFCLKSMYGIFWGGKWFSFSFDDRTRWWLPSTDEFQGRGGKDFGQRHPRIWQCSNNQAAEGGLMCCELAEADFDQQNRSCCPDVEPINLFSIGSKLGDPVKSFTFSSSSLVLVSSSRPTLWVSETSITRFHSRHPSSFFIRPVSPKPGTDELIWLKVQCDLKLSNLNLSDLYSINPASLREKRLKNRDCSGCISRCSICDHRCSFSSLSTSTKEQEATWKWTNRSGSPS